jgi:hypothetical protein
MVEFWTVLRKQKLYWKNRSSGEKDSGVFGLPAEQVVQKTKN